MTKKTAIIFKKANYGRLDGVAIKKEHLLTFINKKLKEGLAKKLIDEEKILMYELFETAQTD